MTLRELRMSSVGCTDLSFLRRNPICELHLSRVLPSRGLTLLNQLCLSNGRVIIGHFDVGDWVGVLSNCTMGMIWAMNFWTVLLSFFVFFYSLVINSVIYLSLFFILLMNMASVSMIPSMLIPQTISWNEVNFLLDNNLSATIKRFWLQAPVVQTLDSAIHRIKIYSVDNVIDFPNTYPLHSGLSGR